VFEPYRILFPPRFQSLNGFFSFSNMSHTPSGKRTTRSNSNPCNSITIADIKALNQANKDEILNSIKSDLNGIKDLLKSLIDRVDHLDQRCAQLEDRCLKLEANDCKQTSTIMEEVEMRFKRRKNVIMSGLDLRMDGSLEERKDDDFEKCSDILSGLGVNTREIHEIYRIGRPGRAGRSMVKVKFVTSEAKQSAIRNSRQLRNSHPNVYINPDRTPLQQFQHRNLEKELRNRREAGEDVIIYRNNVVPRASKQNFPTRF
jgi:hypothetical protein